MDVRIGQASGGTLAGIPPFETLVAGRVAEGLVEKTLRDGIFFGADDGEVQRLGGKFVIGEQRAGGGKTKDDGIGGDVTHGAFGDFFVGIVGGDMEQEIRGADDVNIFVALRVRGCGAIGGGFGAVVTGALGVAEIGVDEFHGGFGAGEPLTISGRAVEGQEGALHGDGVA